MVDSEFVTVGVETQATLTDLGVMPKPGREGEEPQPTRAHRPWSLALNVRASGAASISVGDPLTY